MSFFGRYLWRPYKLSCSQRTCLDVQQLVDFGQFLLLFRSLPDFDGLSLDGFHAGGDHHLCSGDAPYLLPPDVRVALLPQAVHSDGNNPVGQDGQIKVRLDAVVALVVDGAHVKVALQGVEGLFHGSYHIVEFPYVHLVILVEACQHHILAVEFLLFGNVLILALPLHRDGLLLPAASLVCEGDVIFLAYGTVLPVEPSQAVVHRVAALRAVLLCRPSTTRIIVISSLIHEHQNLYAGT